MEIELKAHAKYFYDMGFNISCITNYDTPYNMKEGKRFKNPYHASKHLIDSRQSLEEFNSYDWENAIGLGTFTGTKFGKDNNYCLFALDIDGINYNELQKILTALKVPKYYEWVVKSGSNLGYHIYFLIEIHRDPYQRKDEDEPLHYENNYKSHKNIAYDHDDSIYFNKIELLYNAHIMLPPSLHSSTYEYEFINCKLPLGLPKIIGHDTIWNMQDKVCQFNGNYSSYGDHYEELKTDIIITNDYVEHIKYLVLDIETTGLIEGNKIPNILQIAWYCLDKNRNVIKRDCFAIKNPTTVINNAYNINKLSINKLNAIGYELRESLKILKTDLDLSYQIICHNTDFDIKILNHYYNEYFSGYSISSDKTFCTMKYHSKINNNEKYLSLEDLYDKIFINTHLLRINIKGHNAEIDTFKTYEIFSHFIYNMASPVRYILPNINKWEIMGNLYSFGYINRWGYGTIKLNYEFFDDWYIVTMWDEKQNKTIEKLHINKFSANPISIELKNNNKILMLIDGKEVIATLLPTEITLLPTEITFEIEDDEELPY